MKLTSESQKGGEMTYYLKGRHTRIETSMGATPDSQAVMLWDLEGSKIITLMPSKKMYMTMDLKATQEGLQEASKKMKTASKLKALAPKERKPDWMPSVELNVHDAPKKTSSPLSPSVVEV